MSIFSILGIGNGKIKEALRRGAPVIDVRTATEFDLGKIQGSINIPLDRLNINLERIRHMQKPIIICSNSDFENEKAARARQFPISFRTQDGPPIRQASQ